MTAGAKPLTEHPAWKALKAHYEQVRELHLRKLFAEDPKRGGVSPAPTDSIRSIN